MHILHYSLGFPPYRTGGMTIFCVDLMDQQLKSGHQVSLLWPGQIFGKAVRIKKGEDVNGIRNYELINPLPIPYDEGIQKIEAFTKAGDSNVFISFLKQVKPHVIHIHTFMGLYSSFVDAAKALDIRIVFTTHDFFPICPKVTMYRNGKICDSVRTCIDCPKCNSTALGLNRIQILQSPFYRTLKDTSVVKKLRKHHRDEYLNEKVQGIEESSRNAYDYLMLRKYYSEMLKKIDVIHYNSSVTQSVYEAIIGVNKNRRIPITHKAVSDNRKEKSFSSGQLRIRYLGPQGGVKGFFC